MKKPIKIIAIDDQHLLRQGIRRLIEQEEGMQLVGEGWTGAHLPALMAEYQPDVVFLDVNMPQEEGDTESDFRAFPAIARLHKKYPEALIIILSQYISVTLIEGAFELGVRGYVLKDDIESLNLGEAVRTVREGRYFLSEAIKEELIRSRSGTINDRLTNRQKQIIRQIASNVNLTYGQHAAVLGIQEQTLRNHLTNIFTAMEVPNLACCILKAMQEGLVSFEARYVE